MNDLEIIFEDSELMVINKPVGYVVNNAETITSPTIQDMVSDKIDVDLNENDDEKSEFSSRGGIVHRLDKDTSGLLLVAKNENAFTNLQSQFKNRTVKKTYIAVVFGVVAEQAVEVDAPIKRNLRDRMKYAIVADGKEAQTRFEKIKSFHLNESTYTILNAYPKTGRTHQIRVHLAALNHAIVGDPIYSSSKQRDVAKTLFNRMMLHSNKITFTHPVTHNQMSYEAPLPPEFTVCLEQQQLS